MELVRPIDGSRAASCPGCGGALEDARCRECGVASRAKSYEIVRVLAQSPHGRMYEAQDETGARVALKELAFAAAPSAAHVEAFEREARLLEKLEHPRIPRFLKSFSEGSGAGMRLYLAQQFVTGEPLSRRLEREPSSEAEAWTLAQDVLEVLGYLHGLEPRVLHRDVKPANLIRTPEGRYALVDFGVARELQRDVTHGATLVGTFGYMPPEQLGGTVDARSDLYALGATLLHALTGKAPEVFFTPELGLDYGAHLRTSNKMRRFLARLLAPRADKRFRSASEALLATQAPAGVRAPPWWAIAAAVLAVGAGAAAWWTATDTVVIHHPDNPDTSVYRRPIQDKAPK